MKVCYVTHKPNLTGANQSLLDMLSGWKDYDIEPLVLMPSHGPLEDKLSEIGVRSKVIRYTTAVKRSSDPVWRKPVRVVVNRVYGIKRIKQFLLDERIDLVHNNSFLTGVGMQAAYDLSIPYICHLREFVEEDHRLEFVNKENQISLLGNANVAIAISNLINSKYRESTAKANIITLYNSVDTKKYYIDHPTLLESEDVNVLLCGRISQTKRQIDAIKAIEILYKKGYKNVKLTIVGNGDSTNYNQQIHNYVEQNHISNISFLPFSDLKDIRMKTDIGLMCSSHEAMGRVTIESMLSGCLTIGANAGATPELIDDGVTGFLYNVEDPDSLAETIIKAINNKNNARRIAKNAQKYAMENFGVKRYCEQLFDIYKKSLNKRNTEYD